MLGSEPASLHEHPAVSLEILSAVPDTVLIILEAAEHSRALCDGTLAVCGNILHVDEDTVDDIGDLGPAGGGFAMLSVMGRRLVVRRWCGQHHDTAAGFQLPVTQASGRVDNAGTFTEIESP